MSGMTKYELSNGDISIVAKAVTQRIVVSAELGLNHATTYQRDIVTRIREESIGAAAELAWARLNSKEWHAPINEFHQIPDDGINEVRATEHPRGGLIIRSNDPDDRRYIFATIKDRVVMFHGWEYGSSVKVDSNLWNPHGRRLAWRLDRSKLRPMDEIKPE
jgi:hypothetical protein